jgi:ATP-dependent Lon protease
MNFLAHVFPETPKKLETSLLFLLDEVILLPGITLPVTAQRSNAIGVAQATLLSTQKQLVIAGIRPEVAKRLEADKNIEIKSLEEIYPTATLAVLKGINRLPTGSLQLVVKGLERVKIEEMQIVDHICEVKYQRLPQLTEEAAIKSGILPATIQALMEAIKSLWQEIAAMHPNFSEEVLEILFTSNNPAELAYQTATLLPLDVRKLQALLEQENLEELLRQVLADLSQELEVQRLRGQIIGETKKEIDEQQREFFLRQQLKKIQEQLGEENSETHEIDELRTRIETAQLPEVAFKQAKREFARLERVGSNSAEGGVIRTYLDWLLEMPWNNTIQDNLDLKNAKEVLDIDHHGLTKVKERIIEHLATFKLRTQISETKVKNSESSTHNSVGTVLCFIGPPGVGKTSLGHSVARALGRPFERVSLGGLRDEAELRGHRRTYIGAMPGRIVQALHRSGVKNPVIMLDELDKVGMDYRGDPAAVLLEILDPQQNYCFRDLYLDLDFDLSQVFFIGTANDLSSCPAPLLDRLEIIELSGYSDQEKLAIAEKYLLPRQIEKAGLPKNAVQLTSGVLEQVVEFYTREAGVRRLEQHLASLCRKVAVCYALGDTKPVKIHPEQLEDLLGTKIFLRDELRKRPRPGVATGLAWTLAGGEVLFVEAVQLPQAQELILTGQLGEIMEESARIAYSYVWSNAATLGINAAIFNSNGLHIHVPAGAVPKDGPSAGVTMVTAIASLLTGKPARVDTAMTGEINLSGEVLSIGGVREKVLAAHRAGIKRVLLPKQNTKDLVDVPEDVRNSMEFVFCENIEKVLENTLLNQPKEES